MTCNHEAEENGEIKTSGLPRMFCKHCSGLFFVDAQYRICTAEQAMDAWWSKDVPAHDPNAERLHRVTATTRIFRRAQ